MGFCVSSNDRLSPLLVFFEHLMLPSEGGAFFDEFSVNDPYRPALVLCVFLLAIPLEIVIGRPFFQDFGNEALKISPRNSFVTFCNFS